MLFQCLNGESGHDRTPAVYRFHFQGEDREKRIQPTGDVAIVWPDNPAHQAIPLSPELPAGDPIIQGRVLWAWQDR